MKRPELGDGELGVANRDEPLLDRERPTKRLPDVPPDLLSGELTCGVLGAVVARELERGVNVGELLLREAPLRLDVPLERLAAPASELPWELLWGEPVERLEELPFKTGWPSSKDRPRVGARLGELSCGMPERTVAPPEPRENVLHRELPFDVAERPVEPPVTEPPVVADVDGAPAAPPDLALEVAPAADPAEGNPEVALPLRTVAPPAPELVPPKRRQAVSDVRSAVERVLAAAEPAEFVAEERPRLVTVEPCTAPGVADKPALPARDRAVAPGAVVVGNPAAPPALAADVPPALERTADPDRGCETMAVRAPLVPRPPLPAELTTAARPVPDATPVRPADDAVVASGLASANSRTDCVTLSRCCPKLARSTP